MGTKQAIIPPETSAFEMGFNATTSLNDKISFLKQAAMVSVSVTTAMEKDFLNLVQEHNGLEKVAKNRLQRIQTLESQLDQKKIINAQLYQDLNTTKEKLQNYLSRKK